MRQWIYITYSVIYITPALLLCRKNIAHHAKEAQKYRQKVQEETVLTIMERKKGESARDYVTRVLIDNIVNVHLEPGEKLLENDLSGSSG